MNRTANPRQRQAIILLQDTSIVALRSSVEAHDVGRWAFGSATITAIVAALQLRDLIHVISRLDDPVFVLRVVNLILAIGLAITNILLPRRPDVFYRDARVDRQFTVSLLNRYTWTWIRPLIDYAEKKGDLEEKDIPQPDHILQVDVLVKEWHDAKFTTTLPWSLFTAYKGRLIFQWCVIAVRGVFGLGPFYVMLRLISALEDKVPGAWPTSEMWGYVFWMGFFSLGEMVSTPSPDYTLVYVTHGY